MTKEVIVNIDNMYKMYLEDDWITFSKDNGLTADYTAIPIEVFYQMWNGDELMWHMEAYHQKRKGSE